MKRKFYAKFSPDKPENQRNKEHALRVCITSAIFSNANIFRANTPIWTRELTAENIAIFSSLVQLVGFAF